MTDFDARLEAALKDLGPDPIDETGYYRDALASFKGEGAGMRIMAWVGIIGFGFGLIFCVYKMLTVDALEMVIKYGVFAAMLNQAQIALKLWFNMQLNRRAIIREVRRVGLALKGPTRE